MLGSAFPMFLAWGPDLGFLYNDAYSEILGAKHPEAIGRPFQAIWSEIWSDIDPLIQKALQGQSTFLEDLPLVVTRNGHEEDAWFTFSYSPIREDEGAIAGMFCACTETTRQVQARRRQAFRVVLDDALRNLSDPADIKAAACATLGPHLGVDCVGYAEANETGERTFIERDWTAPGFASAAGPHVLDEYGPAMSAELRAGRTVSIRDTDADPLTGPETARAFAAIGTRAFLNTPLVKDGKLVALLYALSGKARSWTHDEVGLLEEAAERTWAAVERSRSEVALKEEQRTLETLNRIGTVLAAELDLERVVQVVTDAGVELTGAHFGAFFYNVLDPKGGSYMLYTLSGVDRSEFDKFPMPRNTSVFAPTFGGEGVMRSDDILADSRYGKSAPHHGMPKGHLPVRSYLAVPVASRSGEVIGGLFFGHPETARFQLRHERLMVAVAAQAAIAIDNARLFKAAQRDLTERQAAETRLRELNESLEHRIAMAMSERAAIDEALRQSQKMEAIGQLTGGVAHDFNNLLTVIKSSTDLLKRPDLVPERRTRYVAAISETVDRAAKLTAQLLAFARRQSLKPEVFDAAHSVRTIGDMMGTLTGSRIKIVTQLPEEACFLNADPSQFDTALVNMAINARDAMDGEGQLTIEVQPVRQMPAVRTHPPVQGAFVAVSITDTGTGIPEAQLEQIFEPFFTTKGVGKGTGLGLSQVFGFAKQSGGEVTVASQLGKGTTFTLYLPRVDGRARAAEVGEPEPLVDGHGTCVLVVEDNEDVGTFATQTLAELGYVTVWAANAEEALAELAMDADRFDVVFSDVVMPGMNGIDLAHQIRRQHHDLPVLLASGYSHVLAQNGTYGFELLHKPYSVEQLSRLLRKVATWQRRKRIMGK
ncbi:GAF domain-containing protein [Lichenifustis flavocetrariae]|uniref:histidine kinase n=1 Tax=Lichenifustis flavocetrariae TaxID=2949735 RepID=A0AA42CKT9_9HYPH|nr:GAF domain-containing protein [Lichenifustis flavocetrariae]MCW6509631.1 GAF domain-containing protein [Lichenifustis flavocetrariae]